MKFPVSLVAAALCGVLASAANDQVTPVQKVLQMLKGMIAKGQQAKHEEQIQFAAYKTFFDDTSVQKARAISDAKEMISVLQADIEKADADTADLTKAIAEADADIAAWTGDMTAATKVRQLEKADFGELHKDYSESVDALQRAIAVLKAQSHDRKQASAFTQLTDLTSLALIPPEAKKAIAVFLSADPPEDEEVGLDVRAPEANAYEFQSHHIIEVLENLLDKFVHERTDLEKQEMNSQHAYDMLTQDLTAQTSQARAQRQSDTETRAQTQQARATAVGDLKDTTATKEADEKYLADLTATFKQKAVDFEARQGLREDELKAIEEAIAIISSAAVQGNAEKYLPTMLQAKKHTAFAQFRSSMTAGAPQARAIDYLRLQGKRLHSHVLSALAVRISEDPFEKVKQMIKDLIVRLMEEANEEAEHKGWCDTELATNAQTRKEKTAAVELLHAEIDELKASISKLTEEITELSQGVAELDAAMAKATELRQKEKEDNDATVNDAQEAQTAVAQALTILKEFYAKAGEATALVQKGGKQQPTPPPIFDSPYRGLQSENNGVIGMLEVIQSDFARLEADTKAAEAAAQKEYDGFMTDSKVDKAQKEKDIEHKTAKKQRETQAVAVKTSDLEGTQKELDAALSYYDKLKPSCVDASVSYDDRVARRKEEIESLQEALRILNGEELA